MRLLGHLTNEGRRAWTGRLFVLPWVLGFFLFFARPLVQSLVFSFQTISVDPQGLIARPAGIDNYAFAFVQDPAFARSLLEAMQNMAYEVPLIMFFSLFIAVILNQRFAGRTVARAVFFLPVVVTSGIVIAILREDIFARQIQSGNAQAAYVFRASGLQDMLVAAGLDYRLVNYFTNVVNRIFDMAWKSGVQILLFLAGLHTIPPSSYEVAQMEGATGWESFWKITFPLISPLILVNAVFTIIDSFTDYGNRVMQMIYDVAFRQIRFGYGAAIAWIYFLFVFAMLGLVNVLLSRRTFYLVE